MSISERMRLFASYWFSKGAVHFGALDGSGIAEATFWRFWNAASEAEKGDCKFYPTQGPFMICVEGGSSPTRQHETLESAEAEAIRLAENNHGKLVRIVQPVKAFKTRAVTEVVEV
jgi:hypothetical protein